MKLFFWQYQPQEEIQSLQEFSETGLKRIIKLSWNKKIYNEIFDIIIVQALVLKKDLIFIL